MKTQYLLPIIPLFLLLSFYVGQWGVNLRVRNVHLQGYNRAVNEILNKSSTKEGFRFPREEGGDDFVIMERSLIFGNVMRELKNEGYVNVYSSQEDQKDYVRLIPDPSDKRFKFSEIFNIK